jgi:hypothetical protein
MSSYSLSQDDREAPRLPQGCPEFDCLIHGERGRGSWYWKDMKRYTYIYIYIYIWVERVEYDIVRFRYIHTSGWPRSQVTDVRMSSNSVIMRKRAEIVSYETVAPIFRWLPLQLWENISRTFWHTSAIRIYSLDRDKKRRKFWNNFSPAFRVGVCEKRV